jgi:hypothetical protein
MINAIIHIYLFRFVVHHIALVIFHTRVHIFYFPLLHTDQNFKLKPMPKYEFGKFLCFVY